MKRAIAMILALTMMLTAVSGWAEQVAQDEETIYTKIEENASERLGETELPASFYDSSAKLTGLQPVFPDGVTDVTSKTVTMYQAEVDKTMDLTLYFMNGADDLPFINVEDLPMLLDKLYNDPDDVGNRYTKDIVGSCLFLTRENGALCIIDFVNQTIYFDNKPVFSAVGAQSRAALDLTYCDVETSGSDVSSFLKMDIGYVRNGSESEFKLADYQIPMILKDYTGYIPLQTASDIFFADCNCTLAYNGVSVFEVGMGTIDFNNRAQEGTLSALYYAAPATQKSDALAQLTYNELCMTLDYYYGLAEEHDVESFDKLFIDTGMIWQLLNNDPAETYIGLTSLTMGFFRDSHSSSTSQSARIGDREMGGEVFGYAIMSLERTLTMMMKYATARYKFYPDGVPGYEEFGDTAYVTFDQFVRAADRMYRETEITNNPADTLELLLYANKQIHRENSPIKYVVLDLSNNVGGMVDTGVMTIAWLLNTALITMKDVADATESTLIYGFDGNGNGVFGDEDDGLGMSYNIYCLISPMSFSCGNFVPAMLKNSHRVTLLGECSGGGACSVLPIGAADGNLFNISSQYRISTVTNGTYYSVDQGVQPDFVISNPDHLYDRTYLTEYIHQLP